MAEYVDALAAKTLEVEKLQEQINKLRGKTKESRN
jgi:hypothetical protein